MKTHFRSGDYTGELLYPGRQIPDRSLFPYEYKVYDGRFDRVDDMHANPIVDETELNRLHVDVSKFELYNHEMIEFALEEMIERNNGRKPRLKLMLDNSGSMRGRPIEHLTQLVYAIGKACDTLDVPLEIFGYTTVAWTGGQARKDWLQEGRSPSPGRLNDVRYVIYKDVHHSFEESKRNLAAMMKEGFLKENIDGEAIEWAYKRIYEENQPGNVIMHLADGAPIDDSTLSVNPANFLEKHYREATEFVYSRPDTAMYAIGLGQENKRGQFNGDTTVSKEFDEENIANICNLFAGVQIPEALPREGISQGIKEFTDETTIEITHLVELFGTESTVSSHENFSLLSDELKDAIYKFFKENANDIPGELASAIMNFVLDGSVVDIREKIETVLELDFLKKWIIWNEKVTYRSINDFYSEDYKDSVKDANIITFGSFVEGYNLHGPVVFKILNHLLKIGNQDFVSRLANHIATKYIVEDVQDEDMLKSVEKCNHSGMLDYYDILESDKQKDDFISQLLRVIDDLEGYCRFDPFTFCILYKAGIDKAYSIGLKTFFNPLNVQERSEMDRITNTISAVEMFRLNSDILTLSPVHVWEYLLMRNDIFLREAHMGRTFDSVKVSKKDYKNADEINERVTYFQNKKLFLQLFVRDDCIESINKLPEEVFAALMKNKDILSFTSPLKSGDFLLLEPYFEDLYFLTVISDTKDDLNKQIYEYLLMCAKKGEFHELEEDFFEKEEIRSYLSEKNSIKDISDWLKNPQEYSSNMINALGNLLRRSEFFDIDSLTFAFGVERKTFKGLEAISVLLENIVRDYNILNDRKAKQHLTDLLGSVYDLFQVLLANKETMLSFYDGDAKKIYSELCSEVLEYSEKLSEYHLVFLDAELMSQPLEKKEKEEFVSAFTNIENFLSMTQREFYAVYSGYVKKYRESTDEGQQDIFQKLNIMRDLFRKIRGWK